MSISDDHTNNPLPVVIVGCGRVGCQLGKQWLTAGGCVTAVVRNAQQAQRLVKEGMEVVQADLDDTMTLLRLPLQDRVVYYSAPPPGSGREDGRIKRFLESICTSELPRAVVYLGTTGVYGHCHGAWVTEEHATHPANLRSLRRLHAEQLLTAWHHSTGVPVVLLRIAGIYGPGRLPIEFLRKGQAVLGEADAPYSNRIHEEDLVEVCCAAARHATGLHVYNVSDGSPCKMSDYYMQVARMAGLPPPPTVSWQEAETTMGSAMLEFLRESRRIDNRRMLRELGVALKYPDLKSGLASGM